MTISQIKMKRMKIIDLTPAHYNPRKKLKPGDKEYEKLKKSILEFGLVDPLIWNEQTNRLVGGHQRLEVLKEQGVTECDVSVVNLPEAKEKALNIALNKIEGEWDMPMLKELLIELDTGDFDMEITGYDSDEMEKLITIFTPTAEDEQGILSKTKTYTCPACGHEFTIA